MNKKEIYTERVRTRASWDRFIREVKQMEREEQYALGRNGGLVLSKKADYNSRNGRYDLNITYSKKMEESEKEPVIGVKEKKTFKKIRRDFNSAKKQFNEDVATEWLASMQIDTEVLEVEQGGRKYMRESADRDGTANILTYTEDDHFFRKITHYFGIMGEDFEMGYEQLWEDYSIGVYENGCIRWIYKLIDGQVYDGEKQVEKATDMHDELCQEIVNAFNQAESRFQEALAAEEEANDEMEV